eukprot:SAG31_NODE_3598_length_4085_cov_4.935273_3_plen_166_part_00
MLMELIMGQPLFNSLDHFQLVTAIVETLGLPSNNLASKAPHCDMYFVRPRPLSCPEAYDHPPLPPFVTIKRSRSKRATLYYHDSSTNTSSFDRPSLKAEHFASANMQLPGYDWQMRMSSTTGNWCVTPTGPPQRVAMFAAIGVCSAMHGVLQLLRQHEARGDAGN